MIDKINNLLTKLLEREGNSPGQGYQLQSSNMLMNNRPSKILSNEDFEIKTRIINYD